MKAGGEPRLAIIGCGAVVAHHLAPSLRRIGWDPKVLADPSPERLKVVSEKVAGGARAVTAVADWQTVADQFDAAVVAAPHKLHGPIGTALAKAGKHFFMEKPLATTRDECVGLLDAAQANNVIVSVGVLRRYLHVAKWTKALLASGALGEIKRFVAREGFVFNWDTSTDALFRQESSGGGVLMDTGAHTLDMLLWWLGPVKSLEYRDDRKGGVEADCRIDCVLESGAVGTVELSRSRDLRDSVRIEGTRGFVEVHVSQNKVLGGSPHVLSFTHDGFDATNMPGQRFTELFDAELRDFRESVVTGTHRGVSGAEGIHSVDLIERCYEIRQPLELSWDQPIADVGGLDTKPLRGSTVVITGASGFIGGRLAERLTEEYGANVRCIVRSLANCGRLGRLPVQFVKADLTDQAAIGQAMQGADYVFHCAYDVRSRRQNIDGTRNLLAGAANGGVRRFVHVSTFSVYEPFPDGELTEQTCDGDRSWMYVRNKLDIEADVLEAARTGSVQTTVVQPAIVYGPFCKPWTNTPAEMLLYGDVILPKPGDGICNAVYIDDLVDGMIAAALQPAAVGERFILSGPDMVTWGEFFGAFAQTLRTRTPLMWPAEKISNKNHGFVRDLKLVMKNPKRIMQIIVRWDLARRMLQGGLDAMPTSIKALVDRYYFGNGGRKIGEVTLPDPQQLRLYSSKALVHSEKARRILGYRPQVTFESGMTATSAYLEWAYGDVRRTLHGSVDEPESFEIYRPADAASAG